MSKPWRKLEKGDQALNRNFNHQKSSTLYYKDVGLHDQNYSASKKIVGKGDSFTPNGFPPLGSCLSTGQDREQNDQPSDVKQNPIGSGHDKVTSSVPRGRFVHFLVKFWLKYQLHVKSISLTLALKTVQSTV
ncbi:uncharacterized protein LOC116129010 [Pistacia vera]|uniref:uncharacterized protein LOC116129010 n=1 Tax=Pistacia vera TaxID=55513 RepID=UPI001262E7FB|nr:uncharacterized protein LOC116129010 [Pistacia vera]